MMNVFQMLAGRSVLARFSLITIFCIVLAQLALVTLPGGGESAFNTALAADQQRPGFSFSIPVPRLSQLNPFGGVGQSNNDNNRNNGFNDNNRNGGYNDNNRNGGYNDNNRNNGYNDNNRNGGYNDNNRNSGNSNGNQGSPSSNNGGNQRGGGSGGGGQLPSIIQIGVVQGPQAPNVIRELRNFQQN